MRLHRLTGLERDKIIAEYNEILALIARLKEILATEVEIFNIINERAAGGQANATPTPAARKSSPRPASSPSRT